MTDYIIRAALREEANDGWIWIEDFPSRSVVEISNRKNKRSVVCQTRKPDENFLKIYNDGRRHEIKPEQDTIVMSAWYRDALGGFGTTNRDNSTDTKVSLDIRPYRWWIWGQLRAASHHPDIVVRLGTRLGALGVWLGLLGAGLGFLSLFQPDGCARLVASAGVGALVLSVSVVLIGACRGPNTSPVDDHG